MPAFTAVGAYVAGTIFGLVGTAAIVVGAIVAVGAAYITSRIINGNPNKKGNASAASQGGRIQVPPATNNKIPVLYGSAYVNGIITDARLISTDQKTNNTMFYCLVLSETCKTVGAVYDVNNIYWNDLRLTQVDSTTNAHKIKDGRKTVDGPGEDFIDTNFVVDGASLVEVRVYAGSSAANKQIFPTQASGNTQAAYDFWGNDDNSWTTSFGMTGLVFAIVKVTYNGEKGFTALPNMTFDVSNSVNNPADVWQDYMTAVRYGANISVSDIDTAATTVWQNFCNEDISYTNKDGTINQATERYTINGLLDTTRSVKENIDIVLQNGGAWMSYDVATGLWSPVIKKAITAGDPDTPASYFTASRSGSTLTVTAFPEGRIESGQNLYNSTGTLIGTIVAQLAPTAGETAGQKGRYTTSTSGTISSTTFYTTASGLLDFSDDNIISGISISSTRLDDLYNSVEAEFYDQYNKDQKAYARNSIAAGERNPNEPDNQLRMSLDLCNNSMQADILGQMELRQSRDDLVIEFTSNHYGIQTQAGDIVNVYSDLYDWPPKLFRVMRVKEQETEEGGLVAQIQAMEYNGDVYTVEPITEFTTEENIGIGVYGASPNLPPPPDVIIAAIDADVAIPNFQLQVTIPAEGGPYDEIELYYTEGWDEMTVTGSIVPGTGSNGAPVGKGLLTITDTPQGHINPGDLIDLGATDIFIESQIANNPVSKTYVSGGVPVSVDPATTTSRLITLNNDTGLLIGHTLTGTGIPNGSFILEINPTGSPANTVRIEDAVIAQAAGTYTVTGGLGTYIVDTSTTLSGSALLYDFPEVDNYKLLKKITPEGNNPTFTNGQIILDTVTNVPANSATYRRWFIKARMGIKKRFGAFSTPGATDYETGRFPYKPNPSANGGPGVFGDIEIAVETPTTISVVGDNNFITISQTSTSTNVAQNGLRISVESTGTPAPGFGTNIEFEIESAPDVKKQSGLIECALTDVSSGSEDAKLEFTLMTAGVETPSVSPQMTLNNNGDLTITGDLTVTGNDIKSSTATALTLSGANVIVAGDLTVTGTNINTGVTDSIISIDRTGSGTNNFARALILKSTSTGTPTVGFGTAVEFIGQTAASTFKQAGYIAVQSTDITAASEDFTMNFGLMQNGAGYDAKMSLSSAGNLTVDGNLDIGGDLTVSGNEIKSSTGATALTLTGSDVGVAGDLTIFGNTIKDSTSQNCIELNNANVSIYGQLTVVGNVIRSSSAASAIELSGADVDVRGDLTVTGNDIKSSSGTTAITLSGANVTVPGSITATTEYVTGTLSTRLVATATTTSTSQFTLTSTAGRNVMKCVINIVQGANVHCCEAIVLRVDATTATVAVYGEMFNTVKLADFDADVSSGTLRLRVTPTSATSTIFTVLRDSLS